MTRLSVLSTVNLITKSDPNMWMPNMYINTQNLVFQIQEKWKTIYTQQQSPVPLVGLDTCITHRPSAELKKMYIVQWNNKTKQITNSPNYHPFQSLLHFTQYHIPIFFFTYQFNSSKAHKPTKPVPQLIFRKENVKNLTQSPSSLGNRDERRNKPGSSGYRSERE